MTLDFWCLALMILVLLIPDGVLILKALLYRPSNNSGRFALPCGNWQLTLEIPSFAIESLPVWYGLATIPRSAWDWAASWFLGAECSVGARDTQSCSSSVAGKVQKKNEVGGRRSGWWDRYVGTDARTATSQLGGPTGWIYGYIGKRQDQGKLSKAYINLA